MIVGVGLGIVPLVYPRRPCIFSEFTILYLTGAQPTPPSNFRSVETSGIGGEIAPLLAIVQVSRCKDEVNVEGRFSNEL